MSGKDWVLECAKTIYDIQQDVVGEEQPPRETVVSKVAQLWRGMPHEDEFVAIAAWSGRCRWIHKLDQEVHSSHEHPCCRVPDLVACLEYRGQAVPVLIEVKHTTLDSVTDVPTCRLRFTERYWKGLKSYADMVGLPLLVAWNFGNLWALFDFSAMESLQKAVAIDSTNAFKSDLMGLLLGTFSVHFQPGLRLAIGFDKVGPPEEHENGSRTLSLRFAGLDWLRPDGTAIDKGRPEASSLFVAWSFLATEEEWEEKDSPGTVYLRDPMQDSMIWSYWLSGMWQAYQGRWTTKPPFSWRHALRVGNLGPKTKDFRQAAAWGLDAGVVRYVFDMVPAEARRVPPFMAKLGLPECYSDTRRGQPPESSSNLS